MSLQSSRSGAVQLIFKGPGLQYPNRCQGNATQVRHLWRRVLAIDVDKLTVLLDPKL
jgi:hypothetical protein